MVNQDDPVTGSFGLGTFHPNGLVLCKYLKLYGYISFIKNSNVISQIVNDHSLKMYLPYQIGLVQLYTEMG